MPLFCRHNRFEQNCPVCMKEKAAARSASRPARASAPRRAGAATPAARPKRLVTRKLARAADDGYRHDLVPGIKATEDADRLATCLAVATQRLEFPGPFPEVAEAGDVEEATFLAFLLALAGPENPERQAALRAARPAWEHEGETGLGADADRTIAAYRAWAGRAGSQRAALAGEAGWMPQRRFARAFERLSLPGFGRSQRFEFLVVLGAAAVFELEADALKVGGTDPTTVAAKRALVTGETMFLERRAKALAETAGVPIAALDHGLALWDSTAAVEAPEGPVLHSARRALGLS